MVQNSSGILLAVPTKAAAYARVWNSRAIFALERARNEMATRSSVMRRVLAAAGVAAISLALAGCGQTPGCRAATGAGLGAAGGAALGAIGGNPVAGAVAGGVAGAAVGGLTSPDQVNAGPAPCY
jgi:osmotically inducible lipoprotein OsmB